MISKRRNQNWISVLVLGSCLVLMTGCDSFSDKEIKGVLTVDKRQYGNDKLEVNDKDSRLTRFIRPGRKILKFEQGMSDFNLTIMESGGAKLARLEIPMSLVQKKDNNIFVEGRKIDQAWDISADKKYQLLQIEYVANRSSEPCQTKEGPGLKGSVWEVKDFRFDYVVHFQNEVTKKDIGLFVATGEQRTSTHNVHLKSCQPLKKIIATSEAFK